MYGMVNQAVKDLILRKFGVDSWNAVADGASISRDDFEFMNYYPDKITYDLVGSASKVLSLPPEVVLKEFGKHWVLYTAKEGYGSIMDLFGADFKSCLKNLNALHSRMGMTMPHLAPPQFSFEETEKDKYRITYKSKRPGLCPMVEGLFEGLAAKYNKTVKIELLPQLGTEDRQFSITVAG